MHTFNAIVLLSLQAPPLTAAQPMPNDTIMVWRALGEYFAESWWDLDDGTMKITP